MGELHNVPLDHWDNESRSGDALVASLVASVEDHFADYVLWEEAGEHGLNSVREWVRRLLSRAEALGDGPWDRHWVESWREVPESVERNYERALEDWQMRVNDFSSSFELRIAAPAFADLTPDARRLLRDWGFEALMQERPTKPPIPLSQDVLAAQTLAVRGFVAETMISGIGDARVRAERAVDLLDVLGHAVESERVRSYLARCGRCYLSGLFPETVVMACAAIEQRLEEVVAKATIAQILGIGERQVTLGKRLLFAERTGIFSRDDLRRCRALVGQRNDVMHLSPGAGESRDVALEALETLRVLLQRLEVIKGAPGE